MRYVIRNGVLVDKESFRDDAQRIPVSFLPTSPAPRQQQLSPIRPALPAPALDRAVPLPVPESELPDEWHIYSASREKRAFNLNNAAALATGHHTAGLPRYRVFPSTAPSSRSEVLLLAQMLDQMLGRMPNSDAAHQLEVYDLVLSELVRQVWVQCSERGQLLGLVRRSIVRLVRQANERVAQLEAAVRRLREDLAATGVTAAHRIAQLNALSFDAEHEARKTVLLQQMRARPHYNSSGLHSAIDAYTRLSDEERVRLLHTLISTKLQRAEAHLCTQALLASLPRAEGQAIVRDFISESVSSNELVLALIPQDMRNETLRVLVHTMARSRETGRPSGKSAAQSGGGKDRAGAAASGEAAESDGSYSEAAVGAHIVLLLKEAEHIVQGAGARILASAFGCLASAAQRASFVQLVGLADDFESAQSLLGDGSRSEPSAAQLARASELYGLHAGEAPSPLAQQSSRLSPDDDSSPALARLLLADESGGWGGSSASGARKPRCARAGSSPEPEPLHSIGVFAQSGMLATGSRTVDEVASDVLRTSALLPLEETLRQCGELLRARAEAHALDARAGTGSSPLHALIDFWAFNTFKRRSRARAAICSLAASIHHHATFTQHARIKAVARALGVGDSAPAPRARRVLSAPRAAGRAEERDEEGGADESEKVEEDEEDEEDDDDDEEDEDEAKAEPPAFNARLFGFFCSVLELLLPSADLFDAAFATTLPVHVPCELDAHLDQPLAGGRPPVPAEPGAPSAVDAFAAILSLTELNELHFEATQTLVEKLRPLLVPMPLGKGLFSGVALPLDLLLDELLSLYEQLEGERKAQLRALFRKHDENHDGVLDYGEFERLALDFNPLLSLRDISRLFNDVLDESEARRKRGIQATHGADIAGDAADGGALSNELVDVISAEAFAEVVDRFSTQMSATHGAHRQRASMQ